MRVDEVPLVLRPLYLAIGWLLGTLWYLANRIVHATCRIEIIDDAQLPTLDRYILCGWHSTIGPFLAAQPHLEGHVWMNHPAWFMKPVHVLCWWMRIGVVLGSSGNDGRRAAGELIDALCRGARTILWPDGPAGPPKVLKAGVLHIAQQSGAPIVPFAISATRCFRVPGSWDGKAFPLPFGKITLHFGTPIYVSSGDDGIARAQGQLTEALENLATSGK